MTLYRLVQAHDGTVHRLGAGRNTLGRSSENTVVLRDPSVSGSHCEIHVSGDDVLLLDLQSTNGTFVDGNPVTECRITPGQVVQFGEIVARFERDEVVIQVPTIEAPPAGPSAPARLPNGALACSRFPDLPAAFRCVKCERPYHGSALRQVRLSSAKMPLLFCPECDGKCEIIPGFTRDVAEGGPLNPRRLLSRITQTIRIGWKKPDRG